MEYSKYSTLSSRLVTFEPPTKRSKAGWPHKRPSAQSVAQAGFYYCPQSPGSDNVVCYLCDRYLDGWEEDDDPVEEHLKHSPECGWAIMMGIAREDKYDVSEMEDPTSASMAEARRATFAGNWPHECKRGWTCKTEKMVEAGWHFAPTDESDDWVSCAYCKLSLDGWEPKDNPFEEHYKRAPECVFFHFAGTSAPSKRCKANKGRASKAARTSKASARVSTQSAVSMQPEEATINDVPDLDESIDTSTTSVLSTMSTASVATTASKRKAPASRSKNTRAKKAKVTRSTRTKKAKVEIEETMTGPEAPAPIQEEEAAAAPVQEKEAAAPMEQEKEAAAPMEQEKEAAAAPMEQEKEAAAPMEQEIEIAQPAQQQDSGETPTEEAKAEQAPSPAPVAETQVSYPAIAPAEPAPAPEEPEPTTAVPSPSPSANPEHGKEHLSSRSPVREEPPEPLGPLEPLEPSSPSPGAAVHAAESQIAHDTAAAAATTCPPSDPISVTTPSSTADRLHWTPVDVDLVFNSDPSHPMFQAAESFLMVDGPLGEDEKQMTVQEWIHHLARRAEEELKLESERIVDIFAREGERAMEVLEGLECV